MKTVDQIVVSVADDRPKRVPSTSSELGNSLLNLLSSTKKTKREPEMVDPFYFGEIPDEEETKIVEKKEKKKEKKNKKKKSKKGSLVAELDVDVIYGSNVLSPTDDEDDEEMFMERGSSNQIDVDRLFEDDDYDDEMENIIYDQKKAYKKNKKAEGYMNQFAEELTLLYGLLEEANDFGSDLDKLYQGMIKNSRGFSKSTTELINSILSAKQTKLSVLKEISSVKKTIADLTLKESKGSNDNGASGGVNSLAASYLNSIIKHGRNNFVNAMNGTGDDYDQRSEDIDDFVSRVGDYEDDDERDTLNDEILQSLETDSKYNIRSNASEAFIRNESREVTVKVERNIGTGDWEFIAIDKTGLRVWDYPIPEKSQVSPVKFTSDGSVCTDKYGRSYRVIETV